MFIASQDFGDETFDISYYQAAFALETIFLLALKRFNPIGESDFLSLLKATAPTNKLLWTMTS